MSKLISGKSEGGKKGLFFLKFVFQILTLEIKDQKVPIPDSKEGTVFQEVGGGAGI